MIEKLGFLVRFWALSVHHATLGYPLTSCEQIELLALMQLVNCHAELPPVGAAAEDDDALPAQLIGHAGTVPVEVRDVYGAGVVAVAATTMPRAAQVVLRATDAVSGVEYLLPCRVAWVHSGARNTLALRVDGIPARNNFSSPVDPLLRSSGLHSRRPQRLAG